jgi:hypothetical protein
MSKEVKFYRQCSLRKGNVTRVSWIPDCFAEVGKVLQLRSPKGVWDNGWVVETASPPMDAKTVENNARNYIKQREASDIVFSKIKKSNEDIMKDCFNG